MDVFILARGNLRLAPLGTPSLNSKPLVLAPLGTLSLNSKPLGTLVVSIGTPNHEFETLVSTLGAPLDTFLDSG